MKKFTAIALCVLMVAVMAVPALALLSPENPGADFTVTIGTVSGNGNIKRTDNGDGTFTIEAVANEGHGFQKWDIVGDYDVISGSINSSKLTIKPLNGDVTVNVVFSGDSGAKPDGSKTSPETGVPTVMVAFAAVVALGVAVVAGKRAFA